MSRQYSRKVTRRLSRLRGEQRAMRVDLERLRLELVKRQQRQRPALIWLAIVTLVAPIVVAVSILLATHPHVHHTRWSLPGVLYVVAVVIAVASLVWMRRSGAVAPPLRIAVAVTAAATLALSAGLTLESDLVLRTGPRGERGEEGKRGRQGPEGEHGKPGARGKRGPRGERGHEGKRGPRGLEGKRGPRGERGPPGYFYGGS